MDGWHIIVSGQRYIEDLRKASDDTLSSAQAVEKVSYYIMYPVFSDNALENAG